MPSPHANAAPDAAPNAAPSAAKLLGAHVDLADGAEPTEPAALIAHILSRYHEVHRVQLAELVRQAEQVEAAHAGHADLPQGLSRLLREMRDELVEHMMKEENILFPMLLRGGNPFVVRPMGVMRSEHVEHAQRAAQLLALTQAATPPAGACRTWRALYAGVRQFTDDIARHIYLENELLFPAFELRRG